MEDKKSVGIPWAVALQDLRLVKITEAESVIHLTSDNIKLLILDAYLELANKKIVLGADTEVNGSLTLNTNDLGFMINGDDGTTQISPQSIGTYNSFATKSINTIPSILNITSFLSETTDTNGNYSGVFNATANLGRVNGGVTITLTNHSMTFRVFNSGKVFTPNTCNTTYTIFENSVQKKVVKLSGTSLASIATYTTSATSNLTIYTSTVATFGKTVITTVADLLLIGTLSFYTAIPTSSFMLIGYDGLAVNFGNNKTAYFGLESATIKYDNYGLQVSPSGIKKLSNGAWIPLNYINVLSVTGTQYTVPNDCDMVVTKGSSSLRLVFPLANTCKGRIIYVKQNSASGVTIYAGSTSNTSGNNFLFSGNCGSYSSTLNIPLASMMFVSDGTYWICYNCG